MNKNWKKIIAFVIINYVIDELDSPVQKKNVLTIGGKDYPLTTVTELDYGCDEDFYLLIFHSDQSSKSCQEVFERGVDGVQLNLLYSKIANLVITVYISYGQDKMTYLPGTALQRFAFEYNTSTKTISWEINEVPTFLYADSETSQKGPLLSGYYTGTLLDTNSCGNCGNKAVNKKAGWFKRSKSMMERRRKNRL